jgi:heat-inducible transcriptional repressor
MDDKLDERKRKILNIIIREYLQSGEPVGSRTISKDPDLKVSSATIRNEMSDLEEMGYILQPHTSSGRIPSDKGYRFYVDNMILEQDRELSHIRKKMDEQAQKTDKMEKLLQQAVKALAEQTNYTSIVSAPALSSSKVKFIQLSNVSKRNILAVIVLEGNRVKNQMLRVNEDIDNESILKLNILLNTNLNGLNLEQINLGTISSLKEQAGIHSGVVSDVLDLIVEAIHEDQDLQVYTSGTTNILKYPELSDKQKVSELLNTFESKEGLTELISESINPEHESGIQVYIGEETPVDALKDCSVVTATYDFGDNVKGMIGIVGPKRMDYQNVVDNLNVVKEKLDEVFKAKRLEASAKDNE